MSASKRRVAVLGEEGYQELEFWYPVMRLREEGVDVVVAAPQAESAYESLLGYPLLAESALADLNPEELDAVIVPGRAAGEQLGAIGEAASIVSAVHANGGVIGVIGSGAATLERAGVAQDAAHIIRAGAADDLPEFMSSILAALRAIGAAA